MDAASGLGSKKKVEMFLNKMAKSRILLVLLTAVLSSSGKNVVPSLRFLLFFLVSQIQESSEAKQVRLFLLVNIIVIAIWVRSKSLTSLPSSEYSCQAIELAPNQSRPSRHPSRRRLASSGSHANFTDEVHQCTTSRYAAGNQLPNSVETAPSRHTSQNANRQEQVVLLRDDLRERSEAFIAMNHDLWARQQSLERQNLLCLLDA
ncbi:hypothetical protein O6H91_15G047000 [Diphasiastrum complanatum]|uniref:Uncharacterized protein n=1 Tax=Diphasiastrum complanatum TaxID=34168 RepID=A0ACC2BI03_DIPCM|nr:hypothetical protein O6H91_15G047000 [Diphasiastrum complanatum]